MKKKYLYISGAKRWNSLLVKFAKLQKRLERLSLDSSNSSQYKRLVSKLKLIFSKLEKMQPQTGVKLAGTSLAIVLSAFTANAQFAAGEQFKITGNIFELGKSTSDFADIDGDGDEDLYVNSDSGVIEVFTNNNGVYTQVANLQAGGVDINVSNRASPFFADIDGDGDEDLYVGRSNGTMNIFTNNNGNFTADGLLQASGIALDVGNGAVPTFADIDADGDLDLYVGETGGAVETFTNNNGVFTDNGVLGLTDAFPLSQVVAGYSAPTFADIDGDGDLDLYVGTSSGVIETFLNTNGTFSATGELQSNLNVAINNGVKSVPTFRDADNDGDLDLYINSNSNNIFLYTNSGGTFTASGKVQAHDINFFVGSYIRPTFADIDADGDLDLYVGTDAGSIRVFNNTNGILTEAGSLEAGGTVISGYYSAPTFADIDTDGDLDLYFGDYDGGVRSFTNNNGLFTAAPDLVPVAANGVDLYSTPTFADIDGDGDLDLFLGKYDGKIKTYTNNAGVFTIGNDLQAGGADIDVTFRNAPTFADIDGDGDLDLYLGTGNGEIKVYSNSNGVLAAGSNLQAGGTNIDVGSYASPSFADIDGDGDLDLFVGENYGSITFYENTTITAVLVNSISVQGQGGVSTITTQGGTLQIEADILPVNAANGTYTWSVVNGTGSASIDGNGVLTAITDGTVDVIATANDASGEIGTTTITISNQSVGVNEATVQNVKTYPNPVQGQLFIELENETINQFEIIDFSGRIVKSITNNNAKSIDVSELNQGVYILKIETDNGTSTIRFVKK